MIEYSVLMFAVTVLLFVLGVLIYQGNTKLIHNYHQTKVKDKAAYGKAMGKALMVLGTAPAVSGIIGLFGSSDMIAIASVVALMAGIAVGFMLILGVQRKYNKGLF